MSLDRTNSESRGSTDPHLASAVRIQSEPLDRHVLDAFEELESDDGSDLIIELIDLYLQDASQRVIAIRKACVATEWVLLRQAAHNLKGSSSTLGLRQVAEICEKLIDASGSTDGVEALVQLLDYEFSKARQALATERQRRMS